MHTHTASQRSSTSATLGTTSAPFTAAKPSARSSSRSWTATTAASTTPARIMACTPMAWAQAITPVPTNPILTTVLQTTLPMMDRDELLAAGDHNLASTMRLYATTAAGATLEDDGRLLLYSTSATWPGPYHNGAMRLDPTLAPDEVLTPCRRLLRGPPRLLRLDRGARRCRSRSSAPSTPATRRSRQRALPAWPSSTGSTPAWSPAGVTLDEVTDDDARLDYLAVTVDAFADSFLPRDAAEAQLATMRAVCGARRARRGGPDRRTARCRPRWSWRPGSVAGIQLVGTVPDARGRGLGELCTRWAVGAGFDLGARAVVLEASEAGEPLYLRLGFVEVSRYRWCFGPPASRRRAVSPTRRRHQGDRR